MAYSTTLSHPDFLQTTTVDSRLAGYNYAEHFGALIGLASSVGYSEPSKEYGVYCVVCTDDGKGSYIIMAAIAICL